MLKAILLTLFLTFLFADNASACSVQHVTLRMGSHYKRRQVCGSRRFQIGDGFHINGTIWIVVATWVEQRD